MHRYRRTRASPRQNRYSRRVVVGVSVAVACALIAASLLSARTSATSSAAGSNVSSAPAGAAAIAALFRGIPQHGIVLGRAEAPVTLVEYADLQCPYCGMWERNTLPTLVREYVRTGKVRIEFRGLAFIGGDSEVALRAALAAASADRLWNVVELLYLHQGDENSGWVTPALLRGILGAAGVSPAAVRAELGSAAVDRMQLQANAEATADHVRATPTFELGRTGKPLQPLQTSSLSPLPFRTALEQALGS